MADGTAKTAVPGKVACMDAVKSGLCGYFAARPKPAVIYRARRAFLRVFVGTLFLALLAAFRAGPDFLLLDFLLAAFLAVFFELRSLRRPCLGRSGFRCLGCRRAASASSPRASAVRARLQPAAPSADRKRGRRRRAAHRLPRVRRPLKAGSSVFSAWLAASVAVLAMSFTASVNFSRIDLSLSMSAPSAS